MGLRQTDTLRRRREAPPSVLSDLSPARGEIARLTAFPLPPSVQANAKAAVSDLPPRGGDADRQRGAPRAELSKLAQQNPLSLEA